MRGGKAMADPDVVQQKLVTFYPRASTLERCSADDVPQLNDTQRMTVLDNVIARRDNSASQQELSA
jgi:hypothetical protein